MKAVQELIAYFDRRGALSGRQLQTLLDKGFLAVDAPPTIVQLCDTVGASFYFRVRGAPDGPLWGTDIYTGDSYLPAAAVHAGLAKVDETAIVKVTVVAPLQQYQGSVRHGIASRDLGRYGTAYRLSAI
jgi:hypothetical protein